MSESDTLSELRSNLDYEKLIEKASPALQLYIRTLEQDNARLRQEIVELRQLAARRERAVAARESRAEKAPAQIETVRHGDDVMVISITSEGQCKRTPLNDYSTQRRGGVGVLDILTSRDDVATRVLVARVSASLLVLTSQGRAFRVPVDTLPLTEVRGRGTSLPDRLMLSGDESLGAVLALDDELDAQSYVLIAMDNGGVRRLRCNYVGPRLQPGTQLIDPSRDGGAPVAIALSSGDGDVLVALRSGIGIRFPEERIRRDGVLGIQVKRDDVVAGISGVHDDSAVLLVTGDGKATRREMSAFRANKSPGGQGKILMKTDELVDVAAVSEADEVLCISEQSKIIRFAAAEIPAKTGTVQGNSAMDCRGSSLTAVTIVPPPK
jgi:DNA gyrase subunit A